MSDTERIKEDILRTDVPLDEINERAERLTAEAVDTMTETGKDKPLEEITMKARRVKVGSLDMLTVTAADREAAAEARAEERVSVSLILNAALTAVRNRSIERDRDDGERSMEATVTAFNALFNQSLTTEQGWLFMAVLKIARSAGGNMRLDDYTDGSAYMALAGESAAQDRRQE